MRAAEEALADHKYVSPIDVLTGIGLLHPVYVADWKKGRIDFLEGQILGSPAKIEAASKIFREWATETGLRASETRYLRKGRMGTVDLRFTQSGDPAIEKFFQTHYVSPDLSEASRQKLSEKLSVPPQPVVFDNIRESQCSECAAAIESGDFLLMEAGQPLCLACARMDDLEFLPSGDAALTRRSSKYSGRTAVVVRFSKSSGRYDRQGILVEKAAIEKAERECTEDGEDRAKARAAGAARRQAEDGDLVTRMTEEIRELFPRCPPAEAAAIAAHAAVRGSGRVGRTAAGRKLDEGALTAAAAVRHRRTNYDELLAGGVERPFARERVHDRVREILEDWREGRR